MEKKKINNKYNKKSKNIIFLNDKHYLNNLYRKDLILYFKEKRFSVFSIGLKNTLSIFKFFINEQYYVVSSNLKANLFFLFFFKKKGTVIINGLGRFRNLKIFRLLLVFLISFNKNKSFIFQNYADYRYFVKKIYNLEAHWILGSGGTERKSGISNKVITVQRKNKINLVIPSIIKYIKENNVKELYLVGCIFPEKKFFNNDEVKIQSLGYLEQEKIFLNGNIFLQPCGYGEGFPHTLSDAIMSNMEIHMHKKSFISFGLYKYNLNIEKLNNNWIKIPKNSNIKNVLKKQKINKLYFDKIIRKI
ncbi:hypothetical protein [Candidatus Pelagibacter sp. HIMB1695]|uniref:hypothetical protein n=1 Tax=Candidatus Pelagibacter sp. HIMB1695 TaxID=3413364 RepID=UPI003F85756D